ncbi:MAG: hypothetical protein K8R23_04415 [Chthoniobacter sp.]|nr:hypothetical protein [Chthoniobacter sp.]
MDSSAFQAGQAAGLLVGIIFGFATVAFAVVAIILAFVRKTRGWIITACVTGGISLLLVVGTIGAGIYFAQQTAKKNRAMTTIHSTDGLTSIDTPGNWKTLGNLNAIASIQAGNLLREEYAMVISEPNPNGLKLDPFVEAVVAQMVGKMDSGTPGETTKISVNGLEARRVRIDCKSAKLKIVYQLTAIDDGENLHQVLCWTLATKEFTALPVLTRVADSFRVTKPPSAVKEPEPALEESK